MYRSTFRPQISQGDIFRGIPFAIVRFDVERTEAFRSNAILLSHDCEYDKRNAPFALVARVVALDQVAENSQGNIRQRRVHRTFYLERLGDTLPESYVDLDYIERVPKSETEALGQANQRIASLADEARDALQRQIAIFFGHGRQ